MVCILAVCRFHLTLEQHSCSLQNADRAGEGSVMGLRADLFLNLLSVCWNPASPLPLQPRNHSRLQGKICCSPRALRQEQTTPNHLLLRWVCDAPDLQHIDNTPREKLPCLRTTLCFSLNLPLPPALFLLHPFPSLNSVPQFVWLSLSSRDAILRAGFTSDNIKLSQPDVQTPLEAELRSFQRALHRHCPALPWCCDTAERLVSVHHINQQFRAIPTPMELDFQLFQSCNNIMWGKNCNQITHLIG